MNKNKTRRTLLVLGGAGLFVWGANSAVRYITLGGFDFEALADPAGFRRVTIGDVSRRAIDPLIGLDAPKQALPRLPDKDLCDSLFQDVRPGTVPVASFSDYFCPYCRVLTQNLARWHDDGMITVSWHELPLLSPFSEQAARTALAAGLQGSYLTFHERLMRSRVIADTEYVLVLAKSAGLDGHQVVEDMHSEAVERKLKTAHQLADRLGIFGTPALVVGRTVVIGSIDPRHLDQLISLEADLPSACS